jgi:hypothetical protein
VPSSPASQPPTAAVAAISDPPHPEQKEKPMRSLLLYFLGVPIPIIILIALFFR